MNLDKNKEIDKYLNKTKGILKNMDHYDSEGFANQLYWWAKDLSFFYNVVAKDGNLDNTYYHIKPQSKRPNEGQIAYFNLRRGYPKELYDGHWAYVMKDFQFKFLIVPMTSVKKDKPPHEYELDISVKNFVNNLQSRLKLTDMRFIDAQRVNEKHEV